MSEESVAKQWQTIENTLTKLNALRPSRVDPSNYSVKAKIPTKLADLRAGLLYRVAELASVSIRCLKDAEVAAAIVLARSVLETTAAIWFVTRKVERAIDKANVDELDDDLMKMLLGFKASKPSPEMPDAINVMTFIKHVGKDIDNIEGVYADLSEYAHPNWAGTAFLYSTPDPVNVWVDYSPTKNNETPRRLVLVALEISVVMFEHFHTRIDELLPKLIELSEKSLADR